MALPGPGGGARAVGWLGGGCSDLMGSGRFIDRDTGGVTEFFVSAFAAFEFFGSGRELGIHGFEMGFAFEEGQVVGA